jgi:MOSC domain-containing protein YiiM
LAAVDVPTHHLHVHLTTDELEKGLDEVRRSPKDGGRVELIVRRPDEDEREELAEASLSCETGLVGDTWSTRWSRRTGAPPEPERQLTLMNVRAAALVAGGAERRALAGDQLYVDLDLSYSNLPPGSRLEIGSAVVEITEPPHTGCAKFASRFGTEALKFVNSPVGRDLNLRGVNAKVSQAGVVRVGDVIRAVRTGADEGDTLTA